MNITCILPQFVDTFWSEAAELLEPAVKISRGRYDLRAVRRLIQTGHNQLWVMYDDDEKIITTWTTAVENYPCKRMLSVTFLGGLKGEDSLKESDIIHDSIYQFAADNRCDGIEIIGRKGWERVMSKYGYEASYVTMEKEL